MLWIIKPDKQQNYKYLHTKWVYVYYNDKKIIPSAYKSHLQSPFYHCNTVS